ncbi:LysR substrate-binding domain-containing protein [Agrococcus citreus]|uniref:LysR family transcriptional regulator n=1 Tax=Agrococcus citreus TaxID=84643 RepID=A0ABN1YQP0_9MICO
MSRHDDAEGRLGPGLVQPPTPSTPFTLRQLECFVAVADSGSIAAAAGALHASSSAVADAITAMEDALRVRLLVRRRAHGARLTNDGLAALDIARAILAEASDLSAAVGGAGEVRGLVRIGTSGRLGATVLPGLLAAAARELPGLQFELIHGDQDSILERLERRTVDIGLLYDIDVPPEYNRARLATTEAQAVVSSEHRLAHESCVSLSELADEPMILLDIAPSRIHTLELMSRLGIQPRIRWRSPDFDLVLGMVGAGLGYSLVMRRASPPTAVDGSGLRYLPLLEPPRPTDVVLVTLPGAAPARIRAVRDLAARRSAEPSSQRFHGSTGVAERAKPGDDG